MTQYLILMTVTGLSERLDLLNIDGSESELRELRVAVGNTLLTLIIGHLVCNLLYIAVQVAIATRIRLKLRTYRKKHAIERVR